MFKSNRSENTERVVNIKLKKLRPLQVQKIDELLTAIDEYGEIRLVVQNGELRYINRLISHLVETSKSHTKSYSKK